MTYRFTIRPFGTVDTKPTIKLVDGSLSVVRAGYLINRCIMETYGNTVVAKVDPNNGNLVLFKLNGKIIISVELEKIEKERIPGAVPNAA